jgi:hypothetical protein
LSDVYSNQSDSPAVEAAVVVALVAALEASVLILRRSLPLTLLVAPAVEMSHANPAQAETERKHFDQDGRSDTDDMTP